MCEAFNIHISACQYKFVAHNSHTKSNSKNLNNYANDEKSIAGGTKLMSQQFTYHGRRKYATLETQIVNKLSIRNQ